MAEDSEGNKGSEINTPLAPVLAINSPPRPWPLQIPHFSFIFSFSLEKSFWENMKENKKWELLRDCRDFVGDRHSLCFFLTFYTRRQWVLRPCLHSPKAPSRENEDEWRRMSGGGGWWDESECKSKNYLEYFTLLYFIILFTGFSNDWQWAGDRCEGECPTVISSWILYFPVIYLSSLNFTENSKNFDMDAAASPGL